MGKCKYNKCDNELTGRQVYCSDKCRKAQSRTDKSDKLGQLPNSDKESGTPETITVTSGRLGNHGLVDEFILPGRVKELPLDDKLFTGLPVTVNGVDLPDDYEDIMDGLPRSLRLNDDSPAWKNRAFFERIRWLKDTPLAELIKPGVCCFIPAWRYDRG